MSDCWGIKRSFLPIGQGGFCVEQFKYSGKKVNLVYDCGSVSARNRINEEIHGFFSEGEVIDALFISHMHADHINGIKELVEYCCVKTIFYPVISSDTDKRLLIVQAEIDGMIDSFVKEMIRDPRKGIEGIENKKTKPYMYGILENIENKKVSDQDMAHGISSGENLVSFLPEEAKDVLSESYWDLIPYNVYDEDRREQLLKMANKKSDSDQEIEELRVEWEEILKRGDKEGIKRIRSIFRGVKDGFNANSMTLYSGPVRGKWKQIIDDKIIFNAGCLYLGDYNANHGWDNLISEGEYRNYKQMIGCVQIPHHGSRYSFNEKMLELDTLFVILAGDRSRYHHPHNDVLRKLLARDKNVRIANEEKESRIDLCIVAEL